MRENSASAKLVLSVAWCAIIRRNCYQPALSYCVITRHTISLRRRNSFADCRKRRVAADRFNFERILVLCIFLRALFDLTTVAEMAAGSASFASWERPEMV